MNDTMTESHSSLVAGVLPQARVFHIRCAKCGTTTTCDVAEDALRTICPSCTSHLTVPATIRSSCLSCGATNDYPHTLAGHSATCKSCNHPIMVGPVVGKARSRRRIRRRHRRVRSGRTMAYSEGAERALILLVAVLITLIFVVTVSVL